MLSTLQPNNTRLQCKQNTQAWNNIDKRRLRSEFQNFARTACYDKCRCRYFEKFRTFVRATMATRSHRHRKGGGDFWDLCERHYCSPHVRRPVGTMVNQGDSQSSFIMAKIHRKFVLVIFCSIFFFGWFMKFAVILNFSIAKKKKKSIFLSFKCDKTLKLL